MGFDLVVKDSKRPLLAKNQSIDTITEEKLPLFWLILLAHEVA